MVILAGHRIQLPAEDAQVMSIWEKKINKIHLDLFICLK